MFARSSRIPLAVACSLSFLISDSKRKNAYYFANGQIRSFNLMNKWNNARGNNDNKNDDTDDDRDHDNQRHIGWVIIENIFEEL